MPLYPGNILTATAATTSGSPAPSRTWQWLRDNVAIPAATNSTYTVTNADLNTLLGVKQIETNFLGADSASSSQVGPVEVFNPATLFALAEPGVWYDPSDLTTLFQDNLGVSPVTTPGQTVGLMLDKSKGLVLGPELVVNGTFDSGTTGWSATANATAAVVSGEVEVTASAASNGIQQTFTGLTIGGYYLVKGRLRRGVNATEADLRISTTGGVLVSNFRVTSTNNTEVSGFFVATATSHLLRLQFTASTYPATIFADNISVKELPGNHAVQATAASRPLYGIVPRGGRRNLLLYTGFDGAVSGTPGTAPTGWSRFLGTPDGTSIYTPNSALLGGGSIRIQTTLSRYQLGQVVPVAANTSYIISVDCDVVTGSTFNNHLDWVAPPSGSTLSYKLDGASVLAGSVVPTGLHKLEAILSVGATAGNGTMRIGVGVQASNTGDITFSNPQIELGSTATAYQKVTTQYDVTEAGVQSLSYLAFDGASDSMATGTITPGVDKAQIFAGVRKNSDTTAGVIAELSAVSGTSNPGSFFLIGPLSSAATNYSFRSVGSLQRDAIASGYAAPITNVITGLGDIAGDTATIRVDGTEVAQNTADQGAGNYLAYPLYIGARAGTSLYFNGQLYGLITRFGPNLASTNINATEYWLNEKTGAY